MNDVKKNYWRRLSYLRFKRFLMLSLLLYLMMNALQGQTLSQERMSINTEHMALKDLLNEISQVSGCKIFYNASLIKNMTVSVKCENATIMDVLDIALRSD